jgi:hypothetical protein
MASNNWMPFPWNYEGRSFMRTRIGASLLSLLLLTTIGCQTPAKPAATPAKQGGRADGRSWTLSQRQAFDAALDMAREDLFQKLRGLQVAPKATMQDLLNEVVVTRAELRTLVASAEFRRVTWLEGGRCRVEIMLGLIRVAESLDRWDTKGRWAPHMQILEFRRTPMLMAIGESPSPDFLKGSGR